MGIVVAIYLINKLFLISHTSGWIWRFCVSHLNDLVCPIFFLSYVQMVFRWLEIGVLPYRMGLFIGMLAGFIWEYFAPIINPRAITDIYDLICYFCGIHIYYMINLVSRKRI